MADPLDERVEAGSSLELAARAAARYLESLDREPVLPPGAEDALAAWDDPMPEDGEGSLAALRELIDRGDRSATRSSGPRFFHFVMGGGTPAALGADWLTSAYDQVAYGWASSPFAARLEQIAIDWLRQLFELPGEFGGVLTTGATMANFTGLAAARNWVGEQLGVDVEERGLAEVQPPLVLSSGYLHPSAAQAIGMLGFGRGNVRRLSRDAAGRLDLEALERELRAYDGPAIVIANAGEVNAGDFDPIAEMGALTKACGGWLHVDGAFGLFAQLSERTRHLTEGVELADSITCDGHKWLNVPYDCGFAFVREDERLARALNVGAPYLPSADDPHPFFGFLSPENSRRARALPVWATLRAYGRVGYREMVERHFDLAAYLGELVDRAPELERLAAVTLNIVCFRVRPPGVPEAELNSLNTAVAQRLLADGRVIAGSTTYEGHVALRPAIVNWRTSREDVELLVEIVRGIAAELTGAST
jgi:glutamate/tyrosine decarboxylase-like PLP-dependent enzyme